MKKILLFFALIFGLIVLFDCSHQPDAQGQKLAQTHCGSCHQYPSPALLDKTTWQNTVLPQMAIMCGIPSEIAKIPTNKKGTTFDMTVMSAVQLIPDADWLKIKEFYLSEAPDQLPKQERKQEIGKLENLFEVRSANISGKEIANFTCIKIDAFNKIVHATDETNHTWWVLSPDAETITSYPNQEAITSIELLSAPKSPIGSTVLATYMGPSVRVANQKLGSAKEVPLKDVNLSKTLLPKLFRPTQVLSSDLDNDQTPELIAAEYGYAQGGLSVWKRSQSGTYVQKILSASPGAIKSVVIDFDKDGLQDIVTLFAQGNERIVWFRNKGGMIFEEKTLMQFPPVYGSSYFEMKDFNKDDRLDILYTCGDNADYSSVLKPYHGVYIFDNKGNNQFEQSYFFALNGAYKAIANDFDQDGDLDIAAIGFFADFDQQADEGFVFLENKDGDYEPKGLNITNLGRWITMDSGDVDGDGDTDLVLGSHPASPSPGLLRESWYKGSGVVFLLNQKK